MNYTPNQFIMNQTRLKYLMIMNLWNLHQKFLLALDIYSEESTTPSEKGYMLSI